MDGDLNFCKKAEIDIILKNQIIHIPNYISDVINGGTAPVPSSSKVAQGGF